MRNIFFIYFLITSPIALYCVTWTSATSGNWNDSLNWDATFPNAIDAEATFPELGPAAPTTITLAQDITVGTMSVASQLSREYSFAAGNTLTFDVTLGSASLTFSVSSTALSCPIALNDNLNLSSTASAVTFNGIISGSGGITKSGSGTVTFSNSSNSYTGPTSVTAGTLSLLGPIDTSSSVSISSGATISASGTPVVLNELTGAGT